MASPSPDITLYFLGASRAIRIAWLLEELGLPYHLVSSPRDANNLVPAAFKEQIPAVLKKSPTIKDGDLVVQESGAIIDYICETYDSSGRLLQHQPHARARVKQWMHAAEGTFMLHALAILYARWQLTEAAKSSLPEIEEKLSVGVRKDLDWLEAGLGQSSGKFLVGDEITAADIMMQFSIHFISARKLGIKSLEEWPKVEKWLKETFECKSYQKAVEATEFRL